MSNDNPERDRTEALPAPHHTEALPAPHHTEALPAPHHTEAPAPDRPQALPAPAAVQQPQQELQPEPERLRGPSLGPVILGLVCLLVAGAVLAQEVGNWTIDWGNVGPLGIVAAGAVLVVLGAVGLATSRRRS
jgi:hypothetical protein